MERRKSSAHISQKNSADAGLSLIHILTSAPDFTQFDIPEYLYDGIGAVSYTHLDVYKRQVVADHMRGGVVELVVRVRALVARFVIYAELFAELLQFAAAAAQDVYKRQAGILSAEARPAGCGGDCVSACDA